MYRSANYQIQINQHSNISEEVRQQYRENGQRTIDSGDLYIEEWLEEIDDTIKALDPATGAIIYEPIKKLIHHREDGPAKILYYQDGSVLSKEWLINGKKHNAKGPAYLEYFTNRKLKCVDYWLHGKMMTFYIFDWLIFNQFPENWEDWTDEHTLLFYLTWSGFDPNDLEE